MTGDISTSFTPDKQAPSFPEKNRLTLLVGVNTAPESGLRPLAYAQVDAQEMARVLHEHCGFTLFREPLLEAGATTDTLRSTIIRFIRERSDDDFLLFYFAGHGVVQRSDDTDDEDVYLVTSNFSWVDVETDPNMHVSLKWLHTMLYDRCKAGKVLIILDCCYAGNMSTHGPDLEREDLIRRLARYLDINVRTASNAYGLRLALAATTYNHVAFERDGHGVLTDNLLKALSGEDSDASDYKGRVTFNSLRDYLQDQMSEFPPSASGGDAGRNCILALHSKDPVPYFPYGHDQLFRAREGEFESLRPLLCTAGDAPVRLGLTGMGGVGKSRLAIELAAQCQAHFTDGIFWASAGNAGTTGMTGSGASIEPTRADNDYALVHALAFLAHRAKYLPPGEDEARINDEQRARYLCRFLAQHPRALLVLDNLEDPGLLISKLPDLAGMELQCSVLYTSREAFAPPGVKTHPVAPLQNEQDVLFLLLHAVRPEILAMEAAGQIGPELAAAHSICKRVGGLPLALVLLRAQLDTYRWLTVTELDQELRTRGVLAIARDETTIKTSLSAAFSLSWQRVQNESAKVLFQLASYYPEAASIPLWLLALACGLPEEYGLHTPLQDARLVLRRLSLVEDVSQYEIQIHPLLREFGRDLSKEENQETILAEAIARIIAAFGDVLRLQQRAIERSFWICLAQLRLARAYVASMQPDMEEHLRRIERCLDRETYFLGISGLWPERLPGLFYQQMYSHLLEEEQALPLPPGDGIPWLRQLVRVGIADKGLLRVFAGHTGGVNSVAFSPDGSRVLTGSEDHTARLFDTASGETLLKLSGHGDVIECVAYAPDGSAILTGSRDGSVRLWNATSGECLCVFTDHQDWVNGVAFSPDGSLIATCSEDGSARIWNRATGKAGPVFRTPRLFSTFSGIVRTLDLWGESEGTEAASESEHQPITSLAFAPDGSQVALCVSSKLVVLWNFSQNIFASLEPDSPGIHQPLSAILHIMDQRPTNTCIAYSPDGTLLLVGQNDGSVQVWDCVHNFRLRTLYGHTNLVASVVFSHDKTGTYILTGSWDNTARAWETSSGQCLYVFEKQAGTVNSVAFSPDDSTVLTGSSDATARLWEFPVARTAASITTVLSEQDGDNAEEPVTLPGQPLPLFLTRAMFSADGSSLAALYSNSTLAELYNNPKVRLASLYDDSTLRLWNMQSGNEIVIPATYKQAVMGQAFSPDETELAIVLVTGAVEILASDTGTSLRRFESHGSAVWCLDFSPDGQYLLLGHANATARLLDARTGRTLNVLKGHVNGISCVAFSSDNTRVLTGSYDGTVRLWKRHGRTYQPFVLNAYKGPLSSVAFSSDGTKIFASTTNAPLLVWDAATGTLLDEVSGQANDAIPLACSPGENTYVITGYGFNQIRLWHVDAQGRSRLAGAYATGSRLVAMRWVDERHMLLADDAGPVQPPRIYHLQLEN